MPLLPEGELPPKHELGFLSELTFMEKFMYNNLFNKISAMTPRVYNIYIYSG